MAVHLDPLVRLCCYQRLGESPRCSRQLPLNGITEDLARRFAGRPAFAAYVTEIHHAAKRDAPSGTARLLQERLHRTDGEREFPVSSTRAGCAAGTHEVVYDTDFETIRLTHEARSRDLFAAGALTAAEWLRGRHGVFTLHQMLFGENV